jgi:catechol 2,3-dioxygenase-like lactoylglutathione lyase family enzyme
MKSPHDQQPTTAFTPDGIALGSLVVSDLEASAAFYCALLGLTHLREFSSGGEVTGCALGGADLDFALALRVRDGSREYPHQLRQHPLVWRVRDRAALEAFRTRTAELGLASTSGEHDDAAWVEVLDPDGIGVRVALPLRPWTEFHGYELHADGYQPVPGPRLVGRA